MHNLLTFCICVYLDDGLLCLTSYRIKNKINERFELNVICVDLSSEAGFLRGLGLRR